MNLFHHFIELAAELLAIAGVLRGGGEHQIDRGIEFLARVGGVAGLVKSPAALQAEVGLLDEHFGVGPLLGKLDCLVNDRRNRENGLDSGRFGRRR